MKPPTSVMLTRINQLAEQRLHANPPFPTRIAASWQSRALRQFGAASFVNQATPECAMGGNIFGNPAWSTFIKSASSMSELPAEDYPEILITGRANAGKTTLIRKLIGRKQYQKLATSSKPGSTKTLDFILSGQPRSPRKVMLVDSPGYGDRGKAEWGELFEEYITTRQSLKRIYVLININNRVNKYDVAMLQRLEALCGKNHPRGLSFQPIFTRVDQVAQFMVLEELIRTRDELYAVAPSTGKPWMLTSCVGAQPHLGIVELRASMAAASGLYPDGLRGVTGPPIIPNPPNWPAPVPPSRTFLKKRAAAEAAAAAASRANTMSTLSKEDARKIILRHAPDPRHALSQSWEPSSYDPDRERAQQQEEEPPRSNRIKPLDRKSEWEVNDLGGWKKKIPLAARQRMAAARRSPPVDEPGLSPLTPTPASDDPAEERKRPDTFIWVRSSANVRSPLLPSRPSASPGMTTSSAHDQEPSTKGDSH